MTICIKNVKVKRLPRAMIKQEIEDKETEGWHLEHWDGNQAVMRREGGWGSVVGHLLVALFTFWLTLGLGNLVYALYAHGKSMCELYIRAIEPTCEQEQVNQTPVEYVTFSQEVSELIHCVRQKRW